MVNFFNILYFCDRKTLLKKILLELNQNLQNLIHNPRCKDKKCFYCYKYSYYEFNFEMDIFLSKKHIFDVPNLQYDFPLLYQYLYHEISILYDSFQVSRRKTSVPKLFIVITFHMLFEKNYVKCLYLIEKTNTIDTESRDSLYCYQIEFLIAQIYSFYKGKKHKTLNALSSNNDNIAKILHAESLIKNSLNSIKEIMITFNNEYINFGLFSKMIISFLKEYKTLTYKINALFNSTKCNIPYSKEKFSLYFKYVYGEIPEKIISSFDKFFSLQNSSLIEIYMKDTYLLLFKVQFQIKDIDLQIQYGSPELISKLRYTTNQFKVLEIRSLFSKTFYKSYKYIFEKNLLDGTDIFKLSNLCLIDKNKYVILFDLEGVPIYKKHGIELYIKLTEAKEQLLINKNKNSKIERPNASHFLKKSSKSNFCGSSFLFTNKLGKIYNLSRGFEDFFFLNTNVLDRYNINIMELLKIDKLDSKGTFRKKLKDIFDNIYNIYLREVGQLGEDPFSQVILQINEFKKNTSFENNTFNVDVNYEEKSLTREGKRIKYYYLFVLTITLEEKKETFITKEIIQMFQQPINYNQSDMFNDTFINSFLNNLNSIDKNCRQYNEISKKLINIKKLSKIILNKFFKIKTKIPKIEFDEKKNKIKDEEINQSDNYRLLKIKKKEKKEKKEIKKFLIIKYSPILISIIFIILFIIFFYLKITRLKGIKKYFRGSNHALMLIYTSIQMIIKILEIQIKNNELQPDIINNNYNNSY
jgi:hypothetical protein